MAASSQKSRLPRISRHAAAMPTGAAAASAPEAAAPPAGGRSRATQKTSTVTSACSTPTARKELRQPKSATASASGAVPPRFPRLPTATMRPETLPNSCLVNQWLNMVKVAISTDEVPSPSSTRAATAPPMLSAWEKRMPPAAVSTPQPLITTRLPSRSIIGPSGICAAAYT